jgi:hypothetical protein
MSNGILPPRDTPRALESTDYSYLREAHLDGQIWTSGYGPGFERCMQLVQMGLLRFHPTRSGCLTLTREGLRILDEDRAKPNPALAKTAHLSWEQIQKLRGAR